MTDFTWDEAKEKTNIEKHGVDFTLAAQVFKDEHRKTYIDRSHSKDEERFFCLGKVNGRVLTVRFLYRDGKIRIIGAGFWRKGKKYYDQKSIY
ncbi:MAG: BrnT family toxin [Candidatus Omnitrophica bacterium]|nr:BrnT family toxin [Candidatus Omnitrophota bacterium]MDE2215270.1 BrnT family toxin [Candidatus Omnitrophota bacterium]